MTKGDYDMTYYVYLVNDKVTGCHCVVFCLFCKIALLRKSVDILGNAKPFLNGKEIGKLFFCVKK